MNSPDVIIVGAGITGCAAAFELSKGNLKIEVIEKYKPGSMASGWTLAGVRQSGRHSAEIPLAKYSVQEWPNLVEILGSETGYTQKGNLRLARNEEEEIIIRNLVRDQKKAGLDITYLKENKDIQEIAPALSKKVLAASFCSTDGHAEPLKTVQAYKMAAERNGVIFSSNEEVLEINVKNNRVRSVRTSKRNVDTQTCILANGIHCNSLLKNLGIKIPLDVPIVTVIQTEKTAKILKPVIGVANANLAMRQELNGCFRITSGAQKWGGKLEEKDKMPYAATSLEKIHFTIERAIEVIPNLNQCSIKSFWGGLIDLTPDALPVIDQIEEYEGLIVASGFSGHGFGIAPAIGGILADLTMKAPPRLPIDPFSLYRFKKNDNLKEEKNEPTLHG
jgi:sarcosine oxidase subunit beta